MDVTALRDRIESTLDSNADNRKQAEHDLKYVGDRMNGGAEYQAHTWFLSLGRDAARVYQWAVGYPPGRAEQCSPSLR